MQTPEPKIIIAGGGTGGHVFPAIAIAEAIKTLRPEAQILFIGAQGRMEMTKVPEAGFEIIGLPVRGLQRKLSWENIKTIFLLFKSIAQARKIFRQFKPCAVVGVGGYASAPALRVAAKKGIPIVLQEQNSFPGITNRVFARYAAKICVAYPETTKYFPEHKVVVTGNPLRKQILNAKIDKLQALEKFGLSPQLKTLLIVGGSLGARTMNQSVIKNIDLLKQANIQVIWQTGKYYYEQIPSELKQFSWLKVLPFIDDMIAAYTAADLVAARAGALTLAELSYLGKPAILVPSPNVAEDHQTKNAQALVQRNAAIMIPDNQAEQELIPTALKTIADQQLLKQLSDNIKQLARPKAAEEIADIVINQCVSFLKKAKK